MIRKLLWGCILSLCLLGAAAAQGRSIERLLAPTKQLLSDKGSQTATFQSTLIDNAGRTLEHQSGTMYIQGSAFRLEYGAITAVYSGGQLTHYNKDEHTLTLSRPDTEDLVQLNPLYFLRSYAERYRAQALPETKVGPVVGFTPTKKGSIKGIELQLERTRLTPREVLVRSSDGYLLVIKINQLQASTERAASFFTLKASQYPGVEVIDLD